MSQHVRVFVLKPYIIPNGILLSQFLIGRLVEHFLGFCPPFLSLFLSLTDGLICGLDPSTCQSWADSQGALVMALLL
jgi:hypothetical protein